MHGHLLLVHHYPGAIRFMQKALSRKGYITDSAENGEVALAKIRENRPNLVISDILMPDMDAFEMRTHIRRDPSLSELPIIILIVKAGDIITRDEHDRFKQLLSQESTCRDGFLVKPFSPHELTDSVERFLPGPAAKA